LDLDLFFATFLLAGLGFLFFTEAFRFVLRLAGFRFVLRLAGFRFELFFFTDLFFGAEPGFFPVP
jgi:hypothetical protein